MLCDQRCAWIGCSSTVAYLPAIGIVRIAWNVVCVYQQVSEPGMLALIGIGLVAFFNAQNPSEYGRRRRTVPCSQVPDSRAKYGTK